ncbi:Capsular glucan synthase [Pseudobythopirellula maris]|uniref:Capsular glucan synthase n=1 Tax=Pseudobythopirellula maris TaxID=2527991 RepID=A0A5C5ZJ77_9BACT|nr:glycosyltransferase family 4 protein [Pseudobythopirellula maris]TWT87442.1 Capsular glucan synthase [Pseudobythopirellula maris]
MRIVYLAAGAAGMYCGSCLHDNTLAAALIKRGEDVLLVPTYTPLRTDEQDVSEARVFFGGVNAYLQQHSWLFRHTPRWFDRLLDSPGFLRWVTKGAASVDPKKLGAMTVSMLQGEQGRQSKEIEKLADWLADDVKPDVIHLSNSMLLGMARRLKERTGARIVCALSGEDNFLDQLSEPHHAQALALLRERAQEIEAFTALGGYYADHMAEYLGVDRERIHVIPHGLNLEGHGPLESNAGAAPTGTPRIGFFARVCHEKGLHLLVEACERLARERPELPFELRAAGYLGGGDWRYLVDLRDRCERGPLAGRFRYEGELTREAKIAFLRSLAVFSTPTLYREGKGLPALEALANGTPVVLPDHGSFPEIVAATGGGLLHTPGDAAHLAERLAELLADPQRAQALGLEGAAAIRDRFHADGMAEATGALYRRLHGI